MSLPSQVVSDKSGNIFFVEHGGNKIVKISSDNWMMTEFDIPTGPLATVVYIAVSPDASKIWFTEWASNKIGYLDNTLSLPLDLRITNSVPETLRLNQVYPLEVKVSREDILTNTSLSLNDIELSLIGMTESGLRGLTYLVNPQIINLTEATSINGLFNVTLDNDALAGKYAITPRITVFEKDNLTISLSLPQTVKLDTPILNAQLEDTPAESSQSTSNDIGVLLRDLARYGSIGVAITLIGYLTYRKIKKRRN